MKIVSKNASKLLMSGAIAGAVTPFILKWVVMPILNMLAGFIPAFSLKLADPGTISVNIRDSLTGLDGSLGGWLIDAMGLSIADNMMMTVLMGAVGGALLFYLGGYLAEMFGWLKGNKMKQTQTVIFTGSAVAALLFGTIGLPPAIDLSLVNVLIAMAINAGILAWLYQLLDSKAKLGLVPF